MSKPIKEVFEEVLKQIAEAYKANGGKNGKN